MRERESRRNGDRDDKYDVHTNRTGKKYKRKTGKEKHCSGYKN